MREGNNDIPGFGILNRYKPLILNFYVKVLCDFFSLF